MKTNKNKKSLLQKKKHKREVIRTRIFGFFAAIINLFFAFMGGLWIYNHTIAMFLPNHAIDDELFTVVTGLLLVLMGIAGCNWSLHYLFYETKLEKYFPGFFANFE